MPIKITKDGRTIRTGKDYTRFREFLFMRQSTVCIRCGRDTSLSAPFEWDCSFHVHHKNGRGLGGGKRDDAVELCVGLCGRCHRLEHNQ